MHFRLQRARAVRMFHHREFGIASHPVLDPHIVPGFGETSVPPPLPRDLIRDQFHVHLAADRPARKNSSPGAE